MSSPRRFPSGNGATAGVTLLHRPEQNRGASLLKISHH